MTTIEYGKCPRCGGRVDEFEGEAVPLITLIKPLQRGGSVEMVLCAQCGTVIGTYPHTP